MNSTGGLPLLIPRSARIQARSQRASIKAARWASVIRQKLSREPVGILGCYDTGNVGDLALGWTLRRLLRGQGIRARLHSFTQMDQIELPKYVLFGGGGILTTHPTSEFGRAAAQLRGRASQTALVGLSGRLKSDECTDTMRELLTGAAFFSSRSMEECQAYRASIGREDISYHPDIAFGLGGEFQAAHSPSEAKIVGINVSPLLMSVRDGRFVANEQPSEWFKRHFPEVVSVYSQLGPAYAQHLQGVVRIFRQRGWEVRLIPFAIEDATFATSLFKGEHCLPYSSNPMDVLQRVAECRLFISTRFHGLVFALQAGVPCLSIAYAPKCQHLWSDLELDASACIDPSAFVLDPDVAVERLTSHTGVALTTQRREEVRQAAINGCKRAISALLG